MKDLLMYHSSKNQLRRVVVAEDKQKVLQAAFKPVSGETVQLLHNGSNHWLCSAYIGGKVMVADSLNIHVVVTSQVTKQLRELYKGQIQPDGYLPVERLICDQQDNASDCGVFAIAFAFELADGRSLNGVTFTRRRMRKTFGYCI